jgi:hypothetical protein
MAAFRCRPCSPRSRLKADHIKQNTQRTDPDMPLAAPNGHGRLLVVLRPWHALTLSAVRSHMINFDQSRFQPRNLYHHKLKHLCRDTCFNARRPGSALQSPGFRDPPTVESEAAPQRLGHDGDCPRDQGPTASGTSQHLMGALGLFGDYFLFVASLLVVEAAPGIR